MQSSRPSLKRNGIANFLGGALPMIVSLITVPLYLKHIGAERYGVLAIVWTLQGYFGYFDFGLSTATANRIAQLSEASERERESVFWTAFVLNALFGTLGGVILYFAGSFLFSHFHIAPSISAEVIETLPFIACAIPVATLTSVFVGALGGREQFGPLNAAQFAGVLIFQTVPLLAALLIAPQLQYVIRAAVLGSGVSLLILLFVSIRAFPLRLNAPPQRRHLKPLFSYGAAVMVSNFLSPLLDSADRLMIGSILGPQPVAWYQVPFNLATRAKILPAVFSRTLFPRLSALPARDAVELAVRATHALCVLITPPIVFGIFLMQPFITLWVGHDFAARTTSIGEIILIGVWANALAHIPGSHLAAGGRPGIVAWFHTLQAAPLVALLWWTLHHFGLVGAAFSWTLRYVAETVLLFWAAKLGGGLARYLVPPTLLVMGSFIATVVFPPTSIARHVCWFVMVAASLAWALHAEPAWRKRAVHELRHIVSKRFRTRSAFDAGMPAGATPPPASAGEPIARQ
ncbi:flippase [Paraburkholderia diazotrophica]|uniref:Membrane protein involved in the export of O-antigen and teichoic acid n=1 Tax=Paraburkholderia diazotrophica TaxID=667676 RepID=A0A1H6QGF5_9BURK|nr:flippase [Paraburkholderia diazotrophica]SEI40956.1 Membrane protein involved in the export of O-antigen and teichoic acid [Paraburkholderia diazotrophica]